MNTPYSSSDGRPTIDEIDRYLAEQCTPAEAEQVRAWIARYADGEGAVRALRRMRHSIPVAWDPHAQWGAMERRLAGPPSTPASPAHGVPVSPRRMPVRRRWLFQAVAALAAACLVAAAVIHWPASRAAQPQRVVSTAAGERATVRLADGTAVTVGARSTLRYDASFGDRNRNVYLDGEAYFTVSHQSRHPFTVYAARSAVQVLGTSFDVKAYANDPDAVVVVRDGKIALRQATGSVGSGVTLARGDLARVSRAGLITVAHDVATDPYVNWTRGELSYLRAPMHDVARDLERWYDVSIVLADTTAARSLVTVTLDAESLDQALALLRDANDIRVTRRGRVVTMSARAHRP